MAKQTVEIKAISEEQIDKDIIAISKKNPSKIVYAYARLGKVTVTISDTQPKTDCPATVQTYKVSGGFFKNGKIVKPTKSWMNRNNHIPVSH
jgi:hypothetical protein